MNELLGGGPIIIAHVGDHDRQSFARKQISAIRELLALTSFNGPVLYDGITLVPYDLSYSGRTYGQLGSCALCQPATSRATFVACPPQAEVPNGLQGLAAVEVHPVSVAIDAANESRISSDNITWPLTPS